MKSYPKSQGVFYERELLESPAYRTLTRNEIHILNIFYLKRKVAGKRDAKKLQVRCDYVKNNGEIVFTYAEAKEYGFSNATFTRAIDKLVNVGLIEIAEQGGTSQPSKYSISLLWKNFGKPNMVIKERPKLKNQLIGNKTRFKKKEK